MKRGKSKGEFVISVLRRNFLVIYSVAGFVRVCAIRGVCPCVVRAPLLYSNVI